MPGEGVTYEVQQWGRKGPIPGIYDWYTLPFDDFEIEFTGSRAVVSGLDYEHTYDHRVRAKRGDQYSDWTERFKTKVQTLPHVGHQADHTVNYELGAIPTPRPSGSSSDDPGAVISEAIATAVAAWNDAVATPSPHVLFCKGSGCTINGVDRNTDGNTVVIKTETGKQDKTLAYLVFNRDTDGHLRGAATMVIEQPPIDLDEVWGRIPVTRVWTNDLDLHDEDAPAGGIYHYLPSVVMHEFGHAAGLDDLYELEGPLCNKGGDSTWDDFTCAYNNYIMGGDVTETSIPTDDLDYIRDVYRNHTPHPIGAD